MSALRAVKMRIKDLLSSDRGTSLVEFAIVAPVLIFLLIGLIDVGRYTTYAIMTANAARAGAQYGAQNLTTALDTAGVQAAALRDGQNLTNFSAPTLTHLCSVGGGALGACPSRPVPPHTVYYVKVQVNGTFNSLLDYPGIPSSIPVSGSIVMRVAGQ
jgi:Flp pilus assembly protein TadG